MKPLFLTAFGLAILSAQPLMAQQIDFGSNDGEWVNDGECDDPRFEGAGMAGSPLLQEDILHDEADCRKEFKAGDIRLRGIDGTNIDFGQDDGEWTNDGECDDMRFAGPAMTTTALLEDDIMSDASDCRSGFENDQLSLVGVTQ